MARRPRGAAVWPSDGRVVTGPWHRPVAPSPDCRRGGGPTGGVAVLTPIGGVAVLTTCARAARDPMTPGQLTAAGCADPSRRRRRRPPRPRAVGPPSGIRHVRVMITGTDGRDRVADPAHSVPATTSLVRSPTRHYVTVT